jgi:tripartite-type tricarboxylate transporter receptor subunit TctC
VDRKVKNKLMQPWWIGLAAVLVWSSTAKAQDYPNRSVTMVVAAAAGGPIDVFTRIIAQRMSPLLGQSVVVENIGGGGGTVGAQHVAKAEPDGYTTLLGTLATHANPLLYVDKPLYDPQSDFAPVALVAEIPLVLIVRKEFAANTLQEFIAYAKANQDRMNYGSAGVGSASHLGCAMLDQAMGTHIQHVPYRGTGPAMEDLLAGRIDYLCDIAVTAVPSIKNGTVKGIAVLGGQRMAVLPDLQTAGEGGLPSLQASTWTALFLPKGATPAIVAKLNGAVVAAMNEPGLREQLNDLAATLVAPERRTPTYLASFVKSEWDKWGAAIHAGGAIPK